MNFFDKFIELFAPISAAKREIARISLENARRYEGASSKDRLSGWFAPSTSANAETASALAPLRNRVRDLVRNDAFAKRAVNVITGNVVGKGLIADIQGSSAEKTKKLQSVWQQWAGTKAIDADGKLNLSGLQRLACRTIVESGEVLIRLRRRRLSDKIPVPLQIQVLEPDFLDSSRDGNVANSTNSIIQGVEFDALGKPVAYHLYNSHPGDPYTFRDHGSSRIPASDVLHIFRVERSGQVRGVPWGSASVVKLRDFNDYEDAQLIRQKIAACFSAFIYSDNSSDALGGLAASSDTTKKFRVDRISPGTMSHLNPGEQISFANPPSVENYGEYSSQILHRIAAGFDIPYEALTGDFSQVNFSSGRMGWLEFQRSIDIWREDLFLATMLPDIFDWFLMGASFAGIINSQEAKNFYPKWTVPRREMIDPSKEMRANIAAIRAGLTSRTRAIRESGYDPEEVTSEIEKDNADLDAKEIVLDSDPRKVTISGQFQVEDTNSAPNP